MGDADDTGGEYLGEFAGGFAGDIAGEGDFALDGGGGYLLIFQGVGVVESLDNVRLDEAVSALDELSGTDCAMAMTAEITRMPPQAREQRRNCSRLRKLGWELPEWFERFGVREHRLVFMATSISCSMCFGRSTSISCH